MDGGMRDEKPDEPAPRALLAEKISERLAMEWPGLRVYQQWKPDGQVFSIWLTIPQGEIGWAVRVPFEPWWSLADELLTDAASNGLAQSVRTGAPIWWNELAEGRERVLYSAPERKRAPVSEDYLRGVAAVVGTVHEALPVKGYSAQNSTATDAVNANKVLEEQCLRQLDQLGADVRLEPDQRCLSLARTKLQEAFMWANRAVFKPKRIDL